MVRSNCRRILLFAAVVLATSAFAVDGTVLINQASVNAAGGFPYHISQPGSYKLSGNLVVTGNSDAIEIDVNNVTLDLNGFSITGPVQCTTFSATTCSGSAGAGISSWGHQGVTVRNGAIRGMSLAIELYYGTALVEDVQTTLNLSGMGVSDAVVRRSNASYNGSEGIDCGAGGCVLTDNVANYNGREGFVAFDSSLTGNVGNRNGQTGIYAGNSVLNGNTFNGNPTAISNNGDLVSLSNNHCSGGTC